MSEMPEDLLRRLLQWDHFDGAGDGPYWRGAIEASLEHARRLRENPFYECGNDCEHAQRARRNRTWYHLTP